MTDPLKFAIRAGGLTRRQLTLIAVTMLISYTVSLAAIMWRHRGDMPPPSATDFSIEPAKAAPPTRTASASASALAPATMGAPAPAQISGLAEITGAPTAIASTSPTGILAAVPQADRPIEPPSAQPIIPLTPAEREHAEQFCARGGGALNHPLCKRLRASN